MSTYKFKIGGKDYEVAVNGVEDGRASVTVNGVDYDVTLEAGAGTAAAGRAAHGSEVGGPSQTVGSAQPTPAAVAPAPAPGNNAAPSTGGTQITAPLPGVIIDLCVAPGQAVKAGQKVAVLEAMKMENEIQAEKDGTVSEIFVKTGDSVLEGAPIIRLA